MSVPFHAQQTRQHVQAISAIGRVSEPFGNKRAKRFVYFAFDSCNQ